MAPVREYNWLVNGLNYAGLGWGDPEGTPTLCLHGWLDNALSFQALAAYFPERYFVAPDLSGHGHSDWRSADANYNIYDDLPELLAIADQLGWQQFDLIGHSRGAIIASLLAATCPQRISRLVLIDALAPPPIEPADFVDQLGRFLRQKKQYSERKQRVYATEADAVTVRAERDLAQQSAALLVGRNLRACEGGFTWRTDPRLYSASATKMGREEIRAVMNALTMPALLILAEQGMISKDPRIDQLVALAQQMQRVDVPGGHHVHMDDAVQVVEPLQRFYSETEAVCEVY